MPYSSKHMPIGWNGLSMLTEGCSVCMPIVIIYKLRCVEQDSLPYMMKVILIYIPIECWVVDLSHSLYYCLWVTGCQVKLKEKKDTKHR